MKILRQIFIIAALFAALLQTRGAEAAEREDADSVRYDDYCIVLVTSAECGYCIVNTAWFNSLADKYSEEIQMIALNESGGDKIDRLKKMFPDKEVELRGWQLVTNARQLYMPLVERETFPQIILLEKGKPVERFVGTIQPVKEAVEKAIPQFIGKKNGRPRHD